MTVAEVYENALARYIIAFRLRYQEKLMDQSVIAPGGLVTVYAGAFDDMFYPAETIVASNEMDAA